MCSRRILASFLIAIKLYDPASLVGVIPQFSAATWIDTSRAIFVTASPVGTVEPRAALKRRERETNIVKNRKTIASIFADNFWQLQVHLIDTNPNVIVLYQSNHTGLDVTPLCVHGSNILIFVPSWHFLRVVFAICRQTFFSSAFLHPCIPASRLSQRDLRTLRPRQ